MLETFIQKWKNSKDYLREVAEVMPDHLYDFKPTPEVLSFREQLDHTIKAVVWNCGKYLTTERYPGPLKKEPSTKEELLDLLDGVFAYAEGVIRNLKAENLEERVESFADILTKRQILELMDDHVTHHRGQMILYLRLCGIAAPKYRGW